MDNLVALIKAAFAAVKSVEALLPDGSGKDKFDAAVTMISESAGVAVAALPAVEQLINVAVGLLNLFGVFKHKA